MLGKALPFLALLLMSICSAWPASDGDVRIQPVDCTGAVHRFVVSFPSPMERVPSANDTAYFEYWTPSGAAKTPAVLLVHHLGATNLQEEYVIARALVEKGIAVAMPILPYHLKRSAPGLMNGEGVVGTDVPLMLGSIRQAQMENHYITDWLKSRPEIDGSRIGIAGVSLGAIVAALDLTSSSPYQGAVLILGGANVADIMWSGAVTMPLKTQLKRIGYTRERLETELQPIEPTSRVSREWSGRTLMINALYDPVIPRRDTLDLWRALGKPSITWVQSGHYIPEPGSRRVVAEKVADFFLYQFGRTPTYHAVSTVSARMVKLGVFVHRSPTVAFGLAVELLKIPPIGVKPTLDLNANTAGISIGAGLDVNSHTTIGYQRRLIPHSSKLRPYAFYYIVL